MELPSLDIEQRNPVNGWRVELKTLHQHAFTPSEPRYGSVNSITGIEFSSTTLGNDELGRNDLARARAASVYQGNDDTMEISTVLNTNGRLPNLDTDPRPGVSLGKPVEAPRYIPLAGGPTPFDRCSHTAVVSKLHSVEFRPQSSGTTWKTC